MIDPATKTTAQENPSQTSDPQPAAEAVEQPSRKAESDRRNAQKSTGPKTPQGKAYSRLNALKHGILASQVVLAAIEGHEERRMFEETVAGLKLDFQPVGCFEEFLVQQIGSCMWRYRRMARFENRAAFRVTEINQSAAIARDRLADVPPVYSLNGEYDQADGILKSAGLDGITLPFDYHTTQIVRYEAVINRTMHRAANKLEALRERREAKAPRGVSAQAPAEPDPPYLGVIDPGPTVRSQHAGAQLLSVEETVGLQEDLVDSFQRNAQDKEQAERQAREAASPEAQLAKLEALLEEIHQTKPNNPAPTETSSKAASDKPTQPDAISSKLKPPTG